MGKANLCLAGVAWAAAVACGLAADPPGRGLSPEQELASFRFADPQLRIQLVAAEPDVVSPVAIAWDADGRMFVAEMIDYPTGPTGGCIKLLEDRDGDGKYERVTVFADGLSYPNGVLPWKDGVLVTAAPDLVFLRDTDGDGRADERRVVLTGFGQGNPQLRVNGLLWGLDNWIYGANGRSDGEVRRPDDPASKAVSLRGHDFRFLPDTGEVEAIAGRSQFGLARDDWGNRFLSWNTIAMRHEVLPERYLARNPQLAATESVSDLTPPGDPGQVFPLTPTPLTFNSESTSHFNALAGLTIYRGGALGPRHRGSAFLGESLRNLVHRRALGASGPTFVARRAEGEEGKEFLVSTDPWFHPVNFATGPDGALYVVDFYRQFVEHPEFVPANVRSNVAWRSGAEHGRLWKIVSTNPRFKVQQEKPRLSSATAAGLVAHLGHTNGWWRDTAQRLLVERQDRAAVPLLASHVRTNAYFLAQLHALAALDGLGRLTPELLTTALTNRHYAVRTHALRWSEPFLSLKPDSPAHADAVELRRRILAMTNDGDARVQFQLALTLGELDGEEKRSALARLARKDSVTNRWQSLAILSGIGSPAWPFLKALLREDDTWLRHLTAERRQFLERTARLVGTGHSEAERNEFFTELTRQASALGDTGQLVLLAGFGDGLARSGQSLGRWFKEPPAAIRDTVPTAAWLAQKPAAIAFSTPASVSDRLAALRVLTMAPPPFAAAGLLQLLEPGQPGELQAAAARGLIEMGDATTFASLFRQWNAHAASTRRHLLTAAVRSSVATTALVDAMERGQVRPVELDASARQALKTVSDADLRRRVEKILQIEPTSDRAAVVQRFQPSLKLAGDRARGAAIFAKSCLLCHAMQGRGQRVGPDLSGAASRPKEALLVDILDPSRQVSPDFLGYMVTTAQGETHQGLIVAETSTSVTVRRANAPDETILRAQIKELRADAKSLMPDGLEEGLSQQDVADLLEFLRPPDAALLPKEK